MKLKRTSVFLGLGLMAMVAHGSAAWAGEYSPLASGSVFQISDLDSVWRKAFNGTGALFKMRIDHVGYITGCNTFNDTTRPIFTNCLAGQGLTHLLIQGIEDRLDMGDGGKVTIAITSGGGTTAGFEPAGKGLPGCEKVAFLAQSNPARYRMLIGGNPRALTTFRTAGFYRFANFSDTVGGINGNNSSTVFCTLATVP